LGIKGADRSARINALTASRGKPLLHEWCWEIALARLKEVLPKNPRTLSRAQTPLILDDSRFVRLSKTMALVWKGWSGAVKRVGTGHDIVGCVLRSGDEGIPLQVSVASKQGRRKRDKITVTKEILPELARRLRAAGLPPDGLRVVADAWYSEGGLQAVAVAEGVVWISEGKASFPLKALAIKLRSRDGIWAMLAVKVGTFLLGRRLVRQLRRDIPTFRNLTLGQLLRLAQRYAVTWPCIQEHFHRLTVGKAAVLGNL